MRELFVCRVCFVTDVKMFKLRDGLWQGFKALTDIMDESKEVLPRILCYECLALLRKCCQFREKCLKSRRALQNIVLRGCEVTLERIKKINRKTEGLLSNLSLYENIVDIELKNYNIDLVKDESYETIKNETDTIKEESDLYAISLEDAYSPDLSSDDEPISMKIKVFKDDKLQSDHSDVSQGKKRSGRKKFKEEYATVITLSVEEQIGEVRKRKYSLNYTNSPYKCTQCFKGFIDEVAFKNHTARHDRSNGDFQCPICEIYCSTERRLRAHSVAAHERKYSCQKCSHVSNTSNQAREHEKWHQGVTYSCQICGDTFRKSTTHLTHVRLSHPTEFVCDECGDSFVGSHGLAMHKKRSHGRSNNLQKSERSGKGTYCKECCLDFSSLAAWKRHMVTSAKHTTDSKFGKGCRICGETFETEAKLAEHIKTHTGTKPGSDMMEPVKCDECGATFADSRKCGAHYKRMHLGIKYSSKKTIVCEVCGKKCTSNATLAYHQRTHTGEKPFQCAECPKRFSIKQRLQIHERTHSGERPYPCPSCSKAFKHKPALNRHARVHSGARPYACPYCGKSFSQSNSMKLHVHTVHLKLPPPYRNRGGLKTTLTSVPLPLHNSTIS